MTTRTMLLAAGVLLLAAGSAPRLGAQQQAARECAEARTQVEMNECNAEAYREADAEMNRAYASLRDAVTVPADRGALLAAQRAWLRYRDAQCHFEAAGYSGGSMQPMVRSACLAAVTAARAAQLRTLLETAER